MSTSGGPTCMLARAALLPFLLLAAVPAFAEGTVKGGASALFVVSSPLRATVFLDGLPLSKETPVLVRDLPAGRHSVLLHKDGYGQVRIDLQLAAGETRTVSAALSPIDVAFVVRDAAEVVVGGAVESAAAPIGLPQGTYAVGREGARIMIRPVYPGARALSALDLLAPVAALFGGLSAAQDVAFGRGSAWLFSPLTITSFALAAGALGLDVALRVDRSRWQASFRHGVGQATPAETEAELQARAERDLEEGRLDDAVSSLLRHVELYPESSLAPASLYQIGKIQQIQGEVSLAAATFRLLVASYPMPELHDKASKSLADVLLARMDFAGAILALDAMVMLDPLYTEEEIQAYRAQIIGAWGAEDASQWPGAVEAYRNLLRAWPGSSRLPEYRFGLALALSASGMVEEALVELGRAREGATEDLLEGIRQLESEIGGRR